MGVCGGSELCLGVWTRSVVQWLNDGTEKWLLGLFAQRAWSWVVCLYGPARLVRVAAQNHIGTPHAPLALFAQFEHFLGTKFLSAR